MNVRVEQKSTYQGEDWWQWSVWIDGPDEDLDQIEYLEYTLHPTFPKPVRRIAARSTKFRLKSSGWGEFMIYIKIKQQSGEVMEREHWLNLKYPTTQTEDESRRTGGPPTIFLSYGIADKQFASVLCDELKAEGFDILMPDDMDPDLPLKTSLNSLIEDASVGVVVVSDKTSPWIMDEAEAMLKHDIPVIPVIVGADPLLPDRLSGIEGIHLKDVTDPESVARDVAEEIKRKICLSK